jgi:hypothetical protein
MSLFWLNYRHPDGHFAGAVVLEATALVIARMQAAVFGLDDGLYFVSGHEIDDASAQRTRESMIGRLLGKGDLRKLHRMLIQKRPPAPSVKVRPARKPDGNERIVTCRRNLRGVGQPRDRGGDDPDTPQTARTGPHRRAGYIRLG